MIEHYLAMSGPEIAAEANRLHGSIKRLGDLSKTRRLGSEELAELCELTGDWESAQIAHRAWILTDLAMHLCRLNTRKLTRKGAQK
jgi:hypothetical protein